MKPPFLLSQKRQERISRLLKNDFGVRRLVAAFALAQKQVLKLVANLTCGQSGDESPHSKLWAPAI
jgi:hypothetical protein